MEHTRSTSWKVLIAGVGLMEKLGVRTVSLILAMPTEPSLFREPLTLLYESVGERPSIALTFIEDVFHKII